MDKMEKNKYQHSSIHKHCLLNSSQNDKMSVRIVYSDDVKKAISSYLQKWHCLIISSLHASIGSLDIFNSLYLSMWKIFKIYDSLNETWYKIMAIVSYQFIKHKANCICPDYSQMSIEICKRKIATFVTSKKEMGYLGVRVGKRLNFPYIAFIYIYFL